MLMDDVYVRVWTYNDDDYVRFVCNVTPDAPLPLKCGQFYKCLVLQISVEPCRGVLLPLASRSVNVVFSPRFSQEFDTELQFTVVDGSEL